MRRESFPELEILAEGLDFPEGPIAFADGSVVVVEIAGGRLRRVTPDGAVELVADTGGGPNGAARGPDGAIWVANNGGWPGEPTRPRAVQRVVAETGEVEDVWRDVAGSLLAGPNDLVFDADGGLWFTDLPAGRICYGTLDGAPLRVVLEGLSAPNGIGLSPDGGTLYIAETVLSESPFTGRLTRRRIVGPGELAPGTGRDAGAEWDGLPLPSADGISLDSLAVQADGRVCVATCVDPGVVVVTPETGEATFRALGAEWGEQYVTNLCFGGADGRTAFVTLSGRGILAACRWPDAGLALHFQDAPLAG